MRHVLTLAAALSSTVLLSCSGGGGSTAGTGASAASGLDGQWDITAAGDGAIGPSEMTNGGGVYRGVITDDKEVVPVGEGCTRTKDRTEWQITIEGNALSGTFTEIREYTGTGPNCPTSRPPELTTITGTRAGAGSGLDGEWEARIGDGQPFVVSVSGLTAKGWDKEAKAKGREPSVQVTVAGGNVTVTSTDDDLQFAARRR